MTVKEFTWEDGLISSVAYKLNGMAWWLTGTSGVVPESMKNDWNDYQLLLDYTNTKIKQHSIKYTADTTTMDEVWKEILAKEERNIK